MLVIQKIIIKGIFKIIMQIHDNNLLIKTCDISFYIK